MGSDDYPSPAQVAAAAKTREPLPGIGENSFIDGAIVDKNARIGRNVRVVNERGLDTSEETAEYMIADGIVMVQKNAVLSDGWKL
jgi:glucose-1-phosphate adenylyltransferase